MSIESNAKIVSVIGGCHRSGRWIVPARTQMKTLFGRAVIDLREAQTKAEELEFSCLSLFANITFIVPEGAEVRPSGLAILGSSKSTVPLTDVACKLPPMSVDATTIFGRLRIRTTETEPEDTGRESRFRRRRRREIDNFVRAPSALTDPGDPGVDMLDTPAEPTPAHPTAAPTRAVTEGSPDAPEPISTPPHGGSDLSAPIPPFQSDGGRSPIHDVVSPDDISELAEPASRPRAMPASPATSEAHRDRDPTDTDAPAG